MTCEPCDCNKYEKSENVNNYIATIAQSCTCGLFLIFCILKFITTRIKQRKSILFNNSFEESQNSGNNK